MSQRLRSAISETLSRAKRPLGRARFRQALKDSTGPLRIELGAWTTERPGWISTDVHWRGRSYLDATRKWPVPDGSVEFIYADNVIEHLSLEQNRFLLVEAYRVLRPGGRIRLVTPDIEALVRLYLHGPVAAASLIAELRDEGYSVFHQVDLLRFAFQDDGHHEGYLWDFDSLAAELRGAGFHSVVLHESGESDDLNLRLLESRIDSPIADIMLVVEAQKSER